MKARCHQTLGEVAYLRSGGSVKWWARDVAYLNLNLFLFTLSVVSGGPSHLVESMADLPGNRDSGKPHVLAEGGRRHLMVISFLTPCMMFAKLRQWVRYHGHHQTETPFSGAPASAGVASGKT